MNIILVGGNYYGVSGDTNVIKNIGSIMSDNNNVYWIPYLPIIYYNYFKYDNIKILNKMVDFKILKKSINHILYWYKLIFPFIKITPRGLIYFFTSLFDYVRFKEYLKQNKCDIINVHGLVIDSYPYIISAIESNVPLLVTLHGLNSRDKNKKLHFNPKLEKYLLDKLIEKNIKLSVVSTSIKEELIEYFNIPDKNIKILINGVSLNTFNKKISNNNPLMTNLRSRNVKIFLQVGSLNKGKNHIAVLTAIKEMDNTLKEKIHYIIVGDGEEKKQLNYFVKQNNLTDLVTFYGRAYGQELVELYLFSDYFILPSTSEGLPLVWLEALASGLPIITYHDIQGLSDIYNKDCFEIIPNRSTYATIISIQNAINKNFDKAFIRHHAKKYKWTDVVERYIQTYECIIKDINR
jgi:glycosyltransferase involved in cell wall biosynthesis